MEGEKKNRGPNFSAREMDALIQAVSERKNIIENKKSNAVGTRKKGEAWEEVAGSVTAITAVPRTAEQCRGKWNNVKKLARKYATQRVTNLRKTGGGPSDFKENPVYESVLRVIDNSTVTGWTPSYDSDAIEGNCLTDLPNSLSTVMAIQPNNDDDSIFEDAFLDNDLADTPISVMQISAGAIENTAQECELQEVPDETAKSANDRAEVWTQHSARLLKTPRDPVLRVQRKTRVQKASALSAAGKTIQPWLNLRMEVGELEKKRLLFQVEEDKKAGEINDKKRKLEEEELESRKKDLELQEKKRKFEEEDLERKKKTAAIETKRIELETLKLAVIEEELKERQTRLNQISAT